ncbi:protein translocase subunit SecF [Salinisphaera sp. P385]|uniref:Protein-export membrane protein SecF n=1 Tax=Spectribacter acetivorans TaxID=3075603 RepID=A0ABU3BAU1_9GAMM|nr:protein translocase subunit SecF [Salinisphaera sp. P385]MDT0619160.1 protein translocase subunit SecF [Salinisphaera sp. P385]
MRLIRPDTRIDFVGLRKVAVIFSLVVMAVAVGSLATKQLAFGVDFTGGVVIEVGYPEAVELDDVRTALAEGGYTDAVVQFFGGSRDVLIRLAPQEGTESAQVSSNVLRVLEDAKPGVEMRRVEFVGPQVGEELTNKGGLALLYALIGILIYVIFRFHWKLAVGAVAALAHDVVITLGLFSLLQIEFDLTVIAALLAVIGYSLNDTIVIFDRIRENFRRMRKATPQEVVNGSINQTLARTLMTGLTTLLVLLALLFIGGEALEGFSIALIAGVVVGTYSSIYVASSLALWLALDKEDLFPPKEETAEEHM